MVLPGHLAGGYLATKAIVAIFQPALNSSQVIWLYLIGTLAGELPDIDIAWFYLTRIVFKTNSKENHREHATHAPLLWLALSLIIAAAGYILKDIFVQYIGWTILVGTWSHFILDSIEYGIRWLWPFSDKRLCFREVPDADIDAPKGSLSYYWEFVTGHYPRRLTFCAEIIVVVVAILALVS